MERALADDSRERYGSGFHVVGEVVRGDAPHEAPRRPVSTRLSLVPRPLPNGTGDSCDGDDPFAGLERLDREELDEE